MTNSPDAPKTMLDLIDEMLERRRAGIPYPLPEGCPTKGGDSWGTTLGMPSGASDAVPAV